MKPNESAQIEFIKDCLRGGLQRKDIFAKFSKKWQTVAARTFDTRLKAAKDSIQQELKSIKSKTKVSVQKEVDSRKIKILTVIERQELLSQIALGKVKLRNDKFFYDSKIGKVVSEQVDELPNHSDRIKALAELNKMDGSYAPTKQDVTISELPKIIIPGNESSS